MEQGRLFAFFLGFGALSWGCGPSDDELRALGDARLGDPGRTVTVGYIAPERSARACCCPTGERWYDLESHPETCEIYPDAAEGELYYRGSSYLDPGCLTRNGFLEARTVRREIVRCANVACETDPVGGDPPPEEQVQVFTPTPTLEALRKEGGTPQSVDYFVGHDALGAVLSKERKGLSAIQMQFQLKEDPTALDACVVEGRSRRPSNNRKQDFQFRREDGAWR